MTPLQAMSVDKPTGSVRWAAGAALVVVSAFATVLCTHAQAVTHDDSCHSVVVAAEGDGECEYPMLPTGAKTAPLPQTGPQVGALTADPAVPPPPNHPIISAP